MSNYHRRIWFLLFLLLLGSLTTCSGGSPLPTATSLPEASATLTPALPTPEPTVTALPPRVVLLAPDGADSSLVASLQELLSSLAAEAGLRFDVATSLPAEGLAEVKIVVGVSPAAGFADLAASAPQVQFLAVGLSELQAGGNISLIGLQSGGADQAGFLAGYLAAVITPDWRAAVLTQADSPAANTARQAFLHGATYFCGLCRPVAPPFPEAGYPLHFELPAAAGAADWEAAITYFKSWQIQTVYVEAGVSSEELLTALAQSGFNLIGATTPPAGFEAQWVATLGSSDPLQSVREIWPDLLAGKGGADLSSPLTIQQANPQLLSPGRQRLVENILADLESGFIDTGIEQ